MKNNYKNEFYQRIYKCGLGIIKLVENLPRDNISKILSNQLLRSGTSVVANIIKAKSASSKRDYLNFYQYALKSSNESKLWICYLNGAAGMIIMKNKHKI